MWRKGPTDKGIFVAPESATCRLCTRGIGALLRPRQRAPMPDKEAFRKDLENLINKHSMENGSNTHDFVLAEYLCGCLDVFEKATRERARLMSTPLAHGGF
jgi:hypothetical protein